MKVSVVTNFFPPEAHGGAEIFAYDLSLEMAQQGFQIEVFTSTSMKPKEEVSRNLVVRRFRSIPPFPVLTNDLLGYNYNPWARSLARALTSSKADVVHVHNIHTAIMLAPLLRAIRCPVVCHIHDHWPVCYRGTLFDPSSGSACHRLQPSCCFSPGHRLVGHLNLRIRERLVSQFESTVSTFIVPSNYLRDVLAARGFAYPDRLRVIALGIDLRRIPANGAPRPQLATFAGRLTSYKNPRFIFSLAARMNGPSDPTFQLIGTGPEEAELGRELRDKRLSRIAMLGAQPHSTTIHQIARSRALIIPSSIPENSPLVAYEALGCGTPVFCSPLGGTKELVERSTTGAAIALEDQNEWVQTLRTALQDDLFTRASVRAQDFARRELDIRNSGKAIARVYDDALG